jgi:hypothetical protein
MKDPDLQYQQRLREMADQVVRARRALRDAEEKNEECFSAAAQARHQQEVRKKELEMVQQACNALINCKGITEDGLPAQEETRKVVCEGLGLSESR